MSDIYDESKRRFLLLKEGNGDLDFDELISVLLVHGFELSKVTIDNFQLILQ